jgi:hypothetical protein
MHAENPENFAAQARKFSPRSSGNRTGFSADFVGALRAQILQCVGTGSWLSERCMHRCRPRNHIVVARRAAPAAAPAARVARGPDVIVVAVQTTSSCGGGPQHLQRWA